LDEVENPSILKTGQLDPNTVSDQPLAAAPYRASDLVLWHLADIRHARCDVCFGVKADIANLSVRAPAKN
jgi:hypothetical protein